MEPGLGYVGVSSPNHKAWLEHGPEVFGFGIRQSGSSGLR